MSSDVNNKVNICDDVIGIIAGIAATSINGVKCITGGFTKKKIPFLDSKNLKKGIMVEGDNKGLTINVSLVLQNAANIQKVCVSVQEKVKETLEDMLDVIVKDVVVRVDNIIEEKHEK